MRFGLMVVLALSTGCFSASLDGAGDGDFMDDDLPMSNCGTSGGCPSGNVPDDFPCQKSSDCMSGSCVAPYVNGAVGEFVCTSQCIATEDEASWCLDDSACCDADAFCNPRGLCLMPAALDDTAGAATDESGSSTTDATTGDTATDDFVTSTGDLEPTDSGDTAGSTTG